MIFKVFIVGLIQCAFSSAVIESSHSFCKARPELCPSNITYAIGIELGNTSLSAGFSSPGKPGAKQLFDLGLKLYHAFWFELSQYSFQLAQKADPNYIMAYAGEALAYKQPVWHSENVPAANLALSRIPTTARPGNGLEAELLAAVKIYFDPSKSSLERESGYAKAMGKVYYSNPNDSDIGALYALSLLGLASNPNEKDDAKAKSMNVTRALLQKFPKHIPLLHIWTHVTDTPKHAEQGLAQGLELAAFSPDASHSVHMKSHLVSYTIMIYISINELKIAVFGGRKLD
jgi:hypothetical protein